jgi:hypothetical protein
LGKDIVVIRVVACGSGVAVIDSRSEIETKVHAGIGARAALPVRVRVRLLMRSDDLVWEVERVDIEERREISGPVDRTAVLATVV